MRELLPEDMCAAINFNTFEMDEESLVDTRFQNHFTDIAYTAQLTDGQLARLSIIFEHKSWRPESGVIYAQLNRYISNVWAKDLQQKRPLSVVLPIVVYHGETTIVKDTTEALFTIPAAFLGYIPKFDYVLLDLTTLPDTAIMGLEQFLLQKFLLALKNARNAQFIEQNWKSFIIFASELPDNELEERVLTATVIYLSYISQTFKQRIENMDTVLSTEEQKEVLPYIHQMYNFWTKKGIEQGIEKELKKESYVRFPVIFAIVRPQLMLR